MTTTYGDISPRTAAYASKDFLKRAVPYLVFELFGQSKPLPSRSSKSIIFRRYNALDSTPNPLTEGVTPSGKTLTKTDVTATLVQYGDFIELTDVIADTHEDPVLQESIDVLSEQAAEMIEKVRFGILKAGVNVFYANGTSRAEVNTPLTLDLQRRVTRQLKRQNAKRITRVVRSTPNYGTKAVAPAYIGICHPDCETDIRNMNGFEPVEKYGQFSPYPSEIGKVEDVRYVTSTVIEPWPDAGGLTSDMISTSGTKADVYPILYVARDAYGLVALKGKYAITPMVLNPNNPRGNDPLGQRGSVGWKTMQTACILNDAWMVRAEVAVTD